MLQIKKKSKLVLVKYNLQFLFQNKKIAKTYNAKKHVSQLITLRAPKNFNIGKYKIFSLNYKTRSLLTYLNRNVMLSSVITSQDFFYRSLKKKLTLTPTIFLNSIRITIQTKFKIMWLGV